MIAYNVTEPGTEQERTRMEDRENLCDAKIGGVYSVAGMELPKPTQMRLIALGMTRGTNLTVLNKKNSGSVIFYVRGTRLAVGRKIAENIYITSKTE